VSKLLLIDDDRELCDLVAEYLTPEDFDVHSVHDGETGLRRALSGDFAFVVLDVMLPGLGGFEILRRIRAQSSIPVLMLTARGTEIDRILGLETGADDYLPKPFNPRELVARIRAIQRRLAARDTDGASASRMLAVGDVDLDLSARSVRLGGKPVDLTSVEFNVLETLMNGAGTVVTREHLSKTALGRRLSAYDRSIDTHVSNLRRKLGTYADGSERIKSVRSVGYFYALPPSSDFGGASRGG
jgi:two-component system response regulator CpxR